MSNPPKPPGSPEPANSETPSATTTAPSKKSNLPANLERFLLLVPYVASRRDGVPLSELADILSLKVRQLLRLVEDVAMVGMPDGTPDELVEMYVEDDRLFVALQQRFTRPPRFSVEEMLALLFALTPLQDLPSLHIEVLELMEKLTALSSARSFEKSAALLRRIGTVPNDGSSEELLTLFEDAVHSGDSLFVRYYTAHRDTVSERTLTPRGLLSVEGIWYLVDDEDKVFRVDRFESAIPKGHKLPKRTVDLEKHRRRIEARDFGGVTATIRSGDSAENVEANTAHLLRMLRSARGRSVLLSPADLRQTLANEALLMKERYEKEPS